MAQLADDVKGNGRKNTAALTSAWLPAIIKLVKGQMRLPGQSSAASVCAERTGHWLGACLQTAVQSAPGQHAVGKCSITARQAAVTGFERQTGVEPRLIEKPPPLLYIGCGNGGFCFLSRFARAALFAKGSPVRGAGKAGGFDGEASLRLWVVPQKGVCHYADL